MISLHPKAQQCGANIHQQDDTIQQVNAIWKKNDQQITNWSH